MPRRRASSRGRTVLVWLVGMFALLQLGLLTYLDFWRPEAFSAEYEVRGQLLRARLAAEPARPLLLLLGSSRMTLGFRPEILPPLLPSSNTQPLVFNFAHFGSGPTMNLQLLQRLLDQGIHPRWLVVEVMPPKISHDSACWPLTACVLPELPMLCRYFPAWKVLGTYGRIRLSPWNSVRPYVQNHLAPGWRSGTFITGKPDYDFDPLGGDSRWQAVTHLEASEIQRRSEQMGRGYIPEMHDFSVKEGADRAVRDLLVLCRREKIAVVLLLSPESKQFQGYYPPGALAELEHYCQRLHQLYGVPVIDARSWVADEDFMDGHHPLLRGADAFTRRLGREVLQPLVAGADANLQSNRLHP